MSIIKLDLTEHEEEIMNEVMEQVDKTTNFLASLSHEERLEWLREHQYPHPINFEREIGGTIYTVNAHFSDRANETVEGKVERILNSNITH